MDISRPSTQMITEAISSLKEKSGSSVHAIAKFIAEKYYGGGLTLNLKRELSIQLNELTELGRLVKVKRSFKLRLPVKEKSERYSAEIKDKNNSNKKKEKKKEKTIKVKEAVMENKTEGEKETMGIEKHVEKIERMSEAMVPRNSKKEELFQKNKASLEDWKKVAEKSSRVDFALVESLEKLMEVKQDLDGVKGKVLQKIQASEDSVKEKQWEKEAELLEKNGVLMDFYEQRREIVKSIPNFWSTVFMNYLMQRSVANVDKQITKYLESVDVKGRPYVTPVFRVTLNFGENRFFENPSLIRTINYSRERITSSKGTDIKWKVGKGITAEFEEKSNDQSDTDMREENSTDIKWKTGKGIAAGFEEKSSDCLDTDIHKSFFKWFEDSSVKLHDELDEVANSIAHTLWLYAPNYYSW